MNPTFAGFLAFITTMMGISTDVLPPSSAIIQTAYDTATATVNVDLQCIPFPSTSPNFYAQAVYNLGGDILINFAQDQAGAPNVPGSDPPAPFFQNMRAKLGINSLVAGVIQSAGDEGTNQSMLVPEVMKYLTFMNLQNAKTPWGRAYLQIAQQAGYLVGLT